MHSGALRSKNRQTNVEGLYSLIPVVISPLFLFLFLVVCACACACVCARVRVCACVSV